MWEAHVHGVPFEFLVHADGDVSQENDLGEMGSVIGQVGARRFIFAILLESLKYGKEA